MNGRGPTRHRRQPSIVTHRIAAARTPSPAGDLPRLPAMFARVADHPISRIDALLPWNWKLAA
jgi:hypothetical protein